MLTLADFFSCYLETWQCRIFFSQVIRVMPWLQYNVKFQNNFILHVTTVLSGAEAISGDKTVTSKVSSASMWREGVTLSGTF